MNGKILIFEGLTLLLVILAMAWVISLKLTITIDHTNVSVIFFGIPFRRIILSDIEFADRSWCWWNEHYNTTLNPKRIVRLRRRSGLIRNVIITPKDSAEFLTELAARGVEVR